MLFSILVTPNAVDRFAALSAQQQVELLKATEKVKDLFFALILAHTMQSCYGDPWHGGNRDGIGYRSLGIPLTPVRGRSKHDLTWIQEAK